MTQGHNSASTQNISPFLQAIPQHAQHGKLPNGQMEYAVSSSVLIIRNIVESFLGTADLPPLPGDLDFAYNYCPYRVWFDHISGSITKIRIMKP